MSLMRYEPFRELENLTSRLNRVLGMELRPMTMPEGAFADWAPAMDVEETENEYLVKADLPDVKKDDVKVELEDGVLTIEGERKGEKEETGKRFHKVERNYGRFVRHFTLPTEVDGPHVKAEFKDGVLNVRLPKAANVKPKAIEVNVA